MPSLHSARKTGGYVMLVTRPLCRKTEPELGEGSEPGRWCGATRHAGPGWAGFVRGRGRNSPCVGGSLTSRLSNDPAASMARWVKSHAGLLRARTLQNGQPMAQKLNRVLFHPTHHWSRFGAWRGTQPIAVEYHTPWSAVAPGRSGGSMFGLTGLVK